MRARTSVQCFACRYGSSVVRLQGMCARRCPRAPPCRRRWAHALLVRWSARLDAADADELAAAGSVVAGAAIERLFSSHVCTRGVPCWEFAPWLPLRLALLG